MFYHLSALLLFCFYNLIAQLNATVHYQRPIATEFDRCENVNSYLTITGWPAITTFDYLTAPLSCENCPQQTKVTRNKILKLIGSKIIDANQILEVVRKVQGLNSYDSLITALMAINEFTNIDESIKEEVTDALLYLLKKRYLRIYDFTSVRKGFCEKNFLGDKLSEIFERHGNQPLKYLSSPNDQCSCQTKVIEILLKSLIKREQYRNDFKYLPNKCFGPTIANKITRKSEVHPYFDLFARLQNLIKLIPLPKYRSEWEMYERFKRLITSNLVLNIIKEIDLTQISSDYELLDIILVKILHTVTTEEIREVFTYYLNYKEISQANFNFAVLIDILPKPASAKEERRYNLTKHFLLSKLIYSLSRGFVFAPNTNLTDKLLSLFKFLVRINTISPDILEALKYYIAVIEAQQANLHIDQLITLLPSPTNEAEKHYFLVFKDLLLGKDLYPLLKNVNLANLPPNQRLTVILHTLITQTTSIEIQEIAIYYRNLLINQKYGFNYFNLLNILNQTEEDRIYIDTLSEYFYSSEFEIIVSKLKLEHLSDNEKLLKIFNAIKANSSNSYILDVIGYLQQKLEKQIFYNIMRDVIAEISSPTLEIEKVNYDIVVKFLLSETSYDILHRFNLTTFLDKKELREFIFRTVIDSNVSQETKDAFGYYLEIPERMNNLHLITRKEIQKSFNLTDIINSSFDVKSMNGRQKEALKSLFNLVTRGDYVLSKFNTWDKAKTKGEFTKLLIEYILNHDAIRLWWPNMKILKEIIKMDGTGAEPLP